MRLLPPLVALFLALSPQYARAGDEVHVVEKGQTLGRIAKRYHVTVDALRETNGLARGQQIHPGLTLKIPGKDGPAGSPGAHSRTPGREAVDRSRSLNPGREAGDRSTGREAGDRTRAGKGAKGKKITLEEPLAHPPKKPGLVRLVRGDETVELQILTRRGRLVPASLAGLRKMLRSATGETTAIDPGLATMIGMVSDHFGGRPLHVVSGFRPWSPVQYTAHSNHNLGRAMDFSIEGVPNTVVRDFCRTFRNAGVGYYPNGTFVHLDTRAGRSFWVDFSRSGEAPRYEGGAPSGGGDEAEPHPGIEGSEEGDPGSNKTQIDGSQGPGKKPGNGDGEVSPGLNPAGPGQN